MADRTHSHDTSTPAMSAETVPSEEFVLVPREATERMLKATDGWTDLIDAAGGNTPESRRSEFRVAWRAMIAAAPALSAPHLAKKGGEAGAVEPIEKHRIANRLRGMFDMSFKSGDPFNHLSPDGFRLLRQAHDALIAPDEAVAAPAPTPSSAAKGGEAKAKAKQALYSLRFEGQPMSSMFSAEELGLIVDTVSAALSTPTEGPASQTEGMGGDAATGRKFRKTALIEATQWWKDGDHPAVYLREPLGDLVHYGKPVPWCPTLEGGHVVTPGDWIATGSKGEHWPIKPDVFAATYEAVDATLTPPETAEAVPGDLTAVLVQGVQMLSAHIERFHDHEEETEEKVDIRGIKDHLEGAALVSVLGSIPTPSSQPTNAATASDPAPATDDRERLVETLRRLANAEALAGVRGLVAGWNGEDLSEGPFERHPKTLGATLPKTNCGAVYELDEALTAARAVLATEASR